LPGENAVIIRRIFAGERGARGDIVVVNAATALVAAGVAGNFMEAAELARKILASGAAAEKLAALASFTNAGEGR
jgi:anthranilate phosphoribosyltransferase